jgi:23S rRNA (adenine-N6)-dimethyltransferase
VARRASRDRRRAFSQNFLRDQEVIADVIGTLHPPPDALVVDLGAGAGALTAAAAARGARVVAVELDPAWAARLRSRAPGWGAVEVVAGDLMVMPLPAEPFLVLANPPFGVGTQLVRRLVAEAHGLVRAAVVLQREAALRLAGRPRSGRFAATWAPWFDLRVGRTIPANAFRPAPNVDAALLIVAPRATPLLSPAAFAEYEAFLAAIFHGRARTLADRLAPRAGSRRCALAALDSVGLPGTATPSSVPPEAYPRLFRLRGISADRRPRLHRR